MNAFLPAANAFSWENQGAGVAVADLDGNGRPELVSFIIDHPPGGNRGLYQIGWDVDINGVVQGGWSGWFEVPDWGSWENQGGDIAIADLDGDGWPELIVFQIDNPAGENRGLYRVGWKLDHVQAQGCEDDDVQQNVGEQPEESVPVARHPPSRGGIICSGHG